MSVFSLSLARADTPETEPVNSHAWTTVEGDEEEVEDEEVIPENETAEQATVRVMTQVDNYMGKSWKDILLHIKRMKHKDAHLTIRQTKLLDGMRSAVGLPWQLTLAICALTFVLLVLLVAAISLWLATSDLSTQIAKYDVHSVRTHGSRAPLFAGI